MNKKKRLGETELNYSEAMNEGTDIIKKNFWLVLIPIVKDVFLLLAHYLSFGNFIEESTIPQFHIKFTIPSVIPSFKNILDAFPDLISYNTNTGWQDSVLSYNTGIPSPWNKIYILSSIILFVIINTFLKGGFLGCIANSYLKDTKSTLKDFIHYGTYYWIRFIGLSLLGYIFLIFAIVIPPLILVYFIVAIPLLYVSYALVWDDLPILNAISKAYHHFTSQLGHNIGFMLYIAIPIAITSIFLISLARWNIFISLILYNILATTYVAGILVKYAGKIPDMSTHSELDIYI